jgi:membrane protease YdiL (CAAX protease family)
MTLRLPVPDTDWCYAANAFERFQSVVTALINGPAEELLRVYLIARVFSLTKNGPLAIPASAAVFSVYHLYYGWPTVGYFFLVSLFCGWLYFKKNYLLALIVWHILADMSAALYASQRHALANFFGAS